MPRKEQFPAGLREVYEKPENQRDIPPLARPAEHSLTPRLHCYHPDICLLLCSLSPGSPASLSLAFPVPGTLLFSGSEGDRCSVDRTPAELPARICPSAPVCCVWPGAPTPDRGLKAVQQRENKLFCNYMLPKGSACPHRLALW